jgi:hypothetical protein
MLTDVAKPGAHTPSNHIAITDEREWAEAFF